MFLWQVTGAFRPAHGCLYNAELEILGFLSDHAGWSTASAPNGTIVSKRYLVGIVIVLNKKIVKQKIENIKT